METINIKGNVVTIDAMGTQTAIAEKIKSCRADYVLAVKEDQKKLYKGSGFLNSIACTGLLLAWS